MDLYTTSKLSCVPNIRYCTSASLMNFKVNDFKQTHTQCFIAALSDFIYIYMQTCPFGETLPNIDINIQHAGNAFPCLCDNDYYMI